MNRSYTSARRRWPVSSDAKHNHDHQDLYSGLIRLHILHHACEGEFFGLAMIEELGRHGYKLSPGTMYPLLHSLEERGLLVSREKQDGRRYRRLYRATPAGRKALVSAKEKVRELFGELFERSYGARRRRLAKSRR
jgi:PadR family transcriptional regulator, regulatory protein PadR